MLVTSGGYMGGSANSLPPIVNFEVFMDELTEEQQALMELSAKNQELEMRLANMEAWVDKLKAQYYGRIEE